MLKLVANISLLIIALVALYFIAPKFTGELSGVTGNVILDECVDSDGGLMVDVFGVVKQGCIRVEDCCRKSGVGPCVENADALVETHCEQGEPNFLIHHCTYGCTHGACRDSEGGTQDSFAKNPSLLEHFRLAPNCTNSITDIRDLVPSLDCDSASCVARESVRESAKMIGDILPE